MSDEFRYERGSQFRGRFQSVMAFRNDLGGVVLNAMSADRDGRPPQAAAVSIALPASDARRLRDWLNERYPVTETENG